MVSRPTVDPVVQPGDIETLALYYLQPVLSPTPCATRLPQPNAHDDTVSGFLRVEAAGGGKANYLEYDLNVILHAYSPVEMQAANIYDGCSGADGCGVVCGVGEECDHAV